MSYSEGTNESLFAPAFNVVTITQLDQLRFNAYSKKGTCFTKKEEIEGEGEIKGSKSDITRFIYVGRYISLSDNISDHQAHIVPGNLLEEVYNSFKGELDTIAGEIWEKLKGKYTGYTSYILDDDSTAFKSIIIWNPVNICSAPLDIKRGDYPKGLIDVEVLEALAKIYTNSTDEDSVPIEVKNWLKEVNSVKEMSASMTITKGIYVLNESQINQLLNYIKASLALLQSELDNSDSKYVYHAITWVKDKLHSGDTKDIWKPDGVSFATR